MALGVMALDVMAVRNIVCTPFEYSSLLGGGVNYTFCILYTCTVLVHMHGTVNLYKHKVVNSVRLLYMYEYITLHFTRMCGRGEYRYCIVQNTSIMFNSVQSFQTLFWNDCTLGLGQNPKFGIRNRYRYPVLFSICIRPDTDTDNR